MSTPFLPLKFHLGAVKSIVKNLINILNFIPHTPALPFQCMAFYCVKYLSVYLNIKLLLFLFLGLRICNFDNSFIFPPSLPAHTRVHLEWNSQPLRNNYCYKGKGRME